MCFPIGDLEIISSILANAERFVSRVPSAYRTLSEYARSRAGVAESWRSGGRDAAAIVQFDATFSARGNPIASRRLEHSMKGKIVLVTGANGGLGTYVTQAFLDAGATVAGTSRKIQPSDFTHPNFTALPAEISTREGVRTLIDQVVARFGKLDVLAHTVGGFAGGSSIADTDDATFQRMFDINLNSIFHILRAAIPPLRKTGNGRIIAIGSRRSEERRVGKEC